jgi:hypothetical protein
MSQENVEVVRQGLEASGDLIVTEPDESGLHSRLHRLLRSGSQQVLSDGPTGNIYGGVAVDASRARCPAAPRCCAKSRRPLGIQRRAESIHRGGQRVPPRLARCAKRDRLLPQPGGFEAYSVERRVRPRTICASLSTGKTARAMGAVHAGPGPKMVPSAPFTAPSSAWVNSRVARSGTSFPLLWTATVFNVHLPSRSPCRRRPVSIALLKPRQCLARSTGGMMRSTLRPSVSSGVYPRRFSHSRPQ